MPARVGDITELSKALTSVPQKLMIELFGFGQGAEVNAWATRWGCPVGGANVNLFAAFRWFREFFHKHGPTLQALFEEAPSTEELGLGAEFLRAKIDKTREEARMARIRREEKEGTILDQRAVMTALQVMGSRLRQAGEQAQRQFGVDGYNLFESMLDGFNADIETLIRQARDGDGELDGPDAAPMPESSPDIAHPPGPPDGSVR